MTQEISLAVHLNRAEYPVLDTPQLAYLLLEVEPTPGSGAPAADPVPQITPAGNLNLALVLDRSGSMAGEKIARLREAALLAIEQLSADDLVSLVLFDDAVDLLVPAAPAGDKTILRRQIATILERGGTHLSLGLAEGLAQLAQGQTPGRVNHLLLLTDGETWEDEDRCRELATAAGQQGIPITALGLGDEWNQTLLADIASLSGGDWDYVDTPTRILTAFQQVVSNMQQAVVTNAHLVLRLVAGVQPRQVWRVTPLIGLLGQQALGPQDVQVNLGDLQQAGQTLLVELELPPRPAGIYRLAQAEISYELPGTTPAGQRAPHDVLVHFTTNPSSTALDGRVMNLVEKVSAYKLMTRALAEQAAEDMATRTRRLRAAATRLLDLGEETLAEQASAAADQMEAGVVIPAGETKRLVAQTRRLS